MKEIEGERERGQRREGGKKKGKKEGSNSACVRKGEREEGRKREGWRGMPSPPFLSMSFPLSVLHKPPFPQLPHLIFSSYLISSYKIRSHLNKSILFFPFLVLFFICLYSFPSLIWSYHLWGNGWLAFCRTLRQDQCPSQHISMEIAVFLLMFKERMKDGD